MLNIILNKSSRTGKSIHCWHQVREVLEERGASYKLWETMGPGHALKLAREITTQPGMQTVIIVGGDGTVNEVLNGIVDFDRVWLGVIPAGSGNDFAKGIGLYDKPKDCMERILDTRESFIQNQENSTYMNGKKIDLGQLTWNRGRNKRYFGISAGIGMDAIVTKKALNSKQKKILNFFHMGSLIYLLLTLESLVTLKTDTFELSFDGGCPEIYDKMIFSAGMNLKAEGGGVPMAPRATAKNKCLTMVSAYGIPKWRVLFVLALLMMEKHESQKGVKIRKFQQCLVRTKTPTVVHADGEYCGTLREVKFECLKEQLIVL